MNQLNVGREPIWVQEYSKTRDSGSVSRFSKFWMSGSFFLVQFLWLYCHEALVLDDTSTDSLISSRT